MRNDKCPSGACGQITQEQLGRKIDGLWGRFALLIFLLGVYVGVAIVRLVHLALRGGCG